MTRADLRNTEFPGADIGKSTLVDAQVQQSNLRGAKLRKSELTRANFEGANVSEVNFRKAEFRNTVLTGTTMTSTDFRGATFERTSLRGLDLSTVRGLSSGQVAKLASLPATVPVTPSAPSTSAEEKVPTPKVAAALTTRERAAPVAKVTQKPAKTVKAKIATAGGNGAAKVGYRVQFGSFRNEAIANASSNRLAARHQNSFKGVGVGLERTDYGAPRGTDWCLAEYRPSRKLKRCVRASKEKTLRWIASWSGK
jgi:hypothetical protein